MGLAGISIKCSLTRNKLREIPSSECSRAQSPIDKKKLILLIVSFANQRFKMRIRNLASCDHIIFDRHE